MAFNFLGKIPSLQSFKELNEFILIEIEHLPQKINHLRSEELRLQNLLNQLLFADLKLRSNPSYKQGFLLSQAPDLDWFIRTKPLKDVKIKKINDTIVGYEISTLKKPLLDHIKSKRENLSFKSKKVLDLIEQNEQEMELISMYMSSFESFVNSIYDKFNLENVYPEITTLESEKISDSPEYRLYPKNFGMSFVNNKFIYYVKSITEDKIIFEHTAPPVKYGDILNLSKGSNNGPKKVLEILSANTLRMSENLIEEKNSNTEVSIKGDINV